jgi:antitoxin CptB
VQRPLVAPRRRAIKLASRRPEGDTGSMTETPDIRLKRLFMRSIRRGTKEMDIILGRFAEERLHSLDPDTLDTYEALLDEADADLYPWISGQIAPPEQYRGLVATIGAHARAVALR